MHPLALQQNIPDFYPRSPCGERRFSSSLIGRGRRKFLSTLSLRRATDSFLKSKGYLCISIHALLAESDTEERAGLIAAAEFLSTLSLRRATSMRIRSFCGCSDFYPRSPCGERPMMQSMVVILILFLSTLSLRRATVLVVPAGCWLPISIHALLAESDRYVDR